MKQPQPAPKDYRLKVSLRNNRILERIEAQGYASVSEFCRASRMSYGGVSELVRLGEPAIQGNGKWRQLALELAFALGCEPEDLFTERQAKAQFQKTTTTSKIDEPEIIPLAGCAGELVEYKDPVEEAERSRLTQFAMDELKPREQECIARRFGLNGPAETLAEIASDWRITPERVRGIEAVALQKMKKTMTHSETINLSKTFYASRQ